MFLVSAQIQQGKVSDANHLLGGAGYPATVAEQHPRARVRQAAERATSSPGAEEPEGARTRSCCCESGAARGRLSIPRDTVVEIPEAGPQKINAAYAIGGPALTIETVKRFLGIEINHLIEIDFEGFPKLVDAMGGIDYEGTCVKAKISGGDSNGGITVDEDPRPRRRAHRTCPGARSHQHVQGQGERERP